MVSKTRKPSNSMFMKTMGKTHFAVKLQLEQDTVAKARALPKRPRNESGQKGFLQTSKKSMQIRGTSSLLHSKTISNHFTHQNPSAPTSTKQLLFLVKFTLWHIISWFWMIDLKRLFPHSHSLQRGGLQNGILLKP